jgi:hypothetical protein
MNQAPPFDPYRPPAPADYGRPAATTESEVSDAIMDLMRQTKPWVTFLAVLGFIGAGFMVLGGLAVMTTGALTTSAATPKLSGAIGALYIALAALYIYPSLCLLRYGASIGRMLSGGGMDGLTEALGFQKSFWRFTGISAAAIMVLYAVGIAIGIAVAVFAAASHS